MNARTRSNAILVAIFVSHGAGCVAFSPPAPALRRPAALQQSSLPYVTDKPLAKAMKAPMIDSTTTTEMPKAKKAASIGYTTTTEMPPKRRVLNGVNPFVVSPTELEYLTSVALRMGRYNSYLSVAYTAVNKLNPTASLPTKLRNAALMSTRVPRIMELVYNSKNLGVKEGVKTVTKDSRSGKLVLDYDVAFQAIVERAAYLLLADLRNVRDGIYPLPSELKLENQAGPNLLPKILQQLTNGLNFAFQDTYSGNVEDYSPLNEPSPYLKQLAADLDLPDYYLTDYHSVPGGFLSPEHPPVYDLISETVFFGTHLMARRMALRPLAEEMRERGQTFRTGRELKLLDLGTGNGSFLIQLHEAFPELELHGVDLSPSMLEFAEKSFRSHPSMRMADAKLIRASMTNVPVNDTSFDLVTQTNCFHEMPESAIADTAKEIERVLKPGGMFVHLDAVQMKEDPSIASQSRATFDKNFNEPYMLDWMEKVDLDKILAARGMMRVGPPRPYCASTVRCYRKIK